MRWTPERMRTGMVGASLFLLLLLFSISIANSDDVCMANAQLGLNLTWWTGINNFAAFVLVLMAVYVIKPMHTVLCVAAFFVPWHVIGFIIFVTTQSGCIAHGHAVGVAAVVIFVIDVLLVLAGLAMYFRPKPRDLHGAGAGGAFEKKAWWKKTSMYIALLVGISSLIAMSIGASNLDDSCLSDDPSGIDLAQWIMALGVVTFTFFCILSVCGIAYYMSTMDPNARNSVCCYNGIGKASDIAAIWITSAWAVFLIVWIPLGLFLAATTQAACIPDHAALSAGLFFSLVLPVAAAYTIDNYTAFLWKFSTGYHEVLNQPAAASTTF